LRTSCRVVRFVDLRGHPDNFGVPVTVPSQRPFVVGFIRSG